MRCFLFGLLAVSLVNSNFAIAGPFPNDVQNDVHTVSKGGVANGIPTANFNNDTQPDQYTAYNQLTGKSLTSNAGLDPLFISADEVWRELGSGTVILIGLAASNSNTIGTYTDIGVGNNRASILGPSTGFGFQGNGTSGTPYKGGLTGFTIGDKYGWYLESQSGSNSSFFFSEPSLNFDNQFDHLMTFDLSELDGTSVFVDFGSGAVQVSLSKKTFMIGWEDLPINSISDEDYDDIIYLITSVEPVPEPTTLAQLILGLSVLVLRQRRLSGKSVE